MSIKEAIRGKADTILVDNEWLTVSEIMEKIEQKFGVKYTHRQVHDSIVDYEAYFKDSTAKAHKYCLPV